MKKIFKILFVIFLVAIWCNIGYYLEKSSYEAEVKYLNGAKLNTLDKIYMGPSYLFAPKSFKNTVKRTDFIGCGLTILFWPVLALMLMMVWLVKGIIIAALAVWYVVWHGAVWFFRFVFCGGLFRLLGPNFTFLIITIILLILWCWSSLSLLFWLNKRISKKRYERSLRKKDYSKRGIPDVVLIKKICKK